MNLSSFSFSWSNLCCSRSHLSISFCRFLSAISFARLALTRRVITSWASLRSWGQMFLDYEYPHPKIVNIAMSIDIIQPTPRNIGRISTQ